MMLKQVLCSFLRRGICSAAVKDPPMLNVAVRQHLHGLILKYDVVQNKINSFTAKEDSQQRQQLFHQLSSLEPIVKLIQEVETKEKELGELEELMVFSDGKDSEGLEALAKEEIVSCQREIQQLQHALLRTLLPQDKANDRNIILEVRAGAGGKEASLFTEEIFHMYQKWSMHKKWKFEVLECDIGNSGYKVVLGSKHASASLSGHGVFRVMRHESGVHRVQRVPVTEGSGRMHTSTVTVAILPQPTEIDVILPPNDLRVDIHRSSGPGGQHVNTTESAVRLTHIPTGITVRIQDERSQHMNRSKAMKILRARIYEHRSGQAMMAQHKERKQQVGSGERHERIRTYHFPQDRVTDHRVGVTIPGVRQFIEGEVELDNLTEELERQEEAKNIARLLDTLKLNRDT